MWCDAGFHVKTKFILILYHIPVNNWFLGIILHEHVLSSLFKHRASHITETLNYVQLRVSYIFFINLYILHLYDHLCWVAGHFLVSFKFMMTLIFFIHSSRHIPTVTTLMRSNKMQYIIKWMECTMNKGFTTTVADWQVSNPNHLWWTPK